MCIYCKGHANHTGSQNDDNDYTAKQQNQCQSSINKLLIGWFSDELSDDLKVWTSFSLTAFLVSPYSLFARTLPPSFHLLSSLPPQLDSLYFVPAVSPSQRSVLPAGVPAEAGDVYLMSGCWGPSGGLQPQQDNGPRSGFLLAVTDTAALFVGESASQGWSFSQDSTDQEAELQKEQHSPVWCISSAFTGRKNMKQWNKLLMLNYITWIIFFKSSQKHDTD